MKTDWRQVSLARGFDTPPEDLDRIVPVLESLEAAFELLLEGLRYETEPVTVLSFGAIESGRPR